MLTLNNLKKSYDQTSILNGISLSIETGEIVSILGPSGSGKTTLLNCILGITEIDSGSVVFNGQDVTGVSMEERGFNIVFQDYALFPNLNAYENITYGLKNKPGISTQQEVNELIELLGLSQHLDKHIDQLSGGQKQRVALARTMVMKPKILLLDEPLSALDGVIKESIKEKIKTIAKEFHLNYVLIHATEGYLVADILAREGARAVVGPIIGDRSKPELAHQRVTNAARLVEAGVPVAICTDHSELPIQYLLLSAALAAGEGMNPEAALKAITLTAAELGGIAHRVGSLTPGKDADIVLCSGHPFELNTKVQAVFINGTPVKSFHKAVSDRRKT